MKIVKQHMLKEYDSKRMKNLAKNLEGKEFHSLESIFEQILSQPKRKFVETIDIALNLRKPKKKDSSSIRGIISLPNSLSTKKISIAVFTTDSRASECSEADRVGGEDLVKEIVDGKIEYDHYLASPDMIPVIKEIAQKLGPRGLFPSVKNGTMTDDLEKKIKNLRSGAVLQYKQDKGGTVHAKIGLVSMNVEEIKTNFMIFLGDVLKNSSFAKYSEMIKSVYVSSAMGPSILVNNSLLEKKKIV